MPIFTRRRVEFALRELSRFVASDKIVDMQKRYENKNVDQSLPAEIEIVFAWAISQIGNIEIEPSWWPGTRRPDVYSEYLIPENKSIIEITSISDNSIAGRHEMKSISKIFYDIIFGIDKNISSYIEFYFYESNGIRDSVYFREVLAPRNFLVTEHMKFLVTDWIISQKYKNTPLLIESKGLKLKLSLSKYRNSPENRYRSSMPVEIYDPYKNPIVSKLKGKLSQIENAPPDFKRFLFVADIGSTIIRDIGNPSEVDLRRLKPCGTEILSMFVENYKDRVDAVVTFSPYKDPHKFYPFEDKIFWRTTIFTPGGETFPTDGFKAMLRALPNPRVQGQNARSRFKNNFYSFKNFKNYCQTRIRYKQMPREESVSISARALLDFLSKRITEVEFREVLALDEGNNPFKVHLEAGRTISHVKMNERNIDEVDDCIEIFFSDDAESRPLIIL